MRVQEVCLYALLSAGAYQAWGCLRAMWGLSDCRILFENQRQSRQWRQPGKPPWTPGARINLKRAWSNGVTTVTFADRIQVLPRIPYLSCQGSLRQPLMNIKILSLKGLKTPVQHPGWFFFFRWRRFSYSEVRVVNTVVAAGNANVRFCFMQTDREEMGCHHRPWTTFSLCAP